MRILIATGLYAPDIGGPATYTAFLEKHLPLHGISYEVLPYGRVRCFPKLFRHVAYLALLLWHARRTDIFYALDTVSVGFPVMVASWLTRTPYLLRVPGDYAWEQGSIRYGITETLDEYLTHTRHPWRVGILAWLQKKVAMRAYHVIVPSEYLKRVVSAWGVSQEKITRVYSALKTIAVADAKDNLKTIYGYNNFTVTTAGRLVPWKGMSALIDVVCEMRKDGTPVTLEIIGDGVLRSEISAHVTKMNASEYVHLRGAVTREELAQRVYASDAFVLNTAYEGLSHQLLEVMSLDIPTVTTPVGGNTELVDDGVTGILVPYNDVQQMKEALMRLCADSTLRDTLAKNAHASLEKFYEDVVVGELVTLLKTFSL